jgi:large conductance mechanosensitive channel
MAEETKPAYFDPAKKAFTLLGEFQNFAFKGNVIDLAVGVIIGGAFGKIVDSLVKQIIMPLIAMITPGNQEYVKWTWKHAGKEVPYGLFLGEVVNFLIIALVLFFFIVKFLGWIMRAKKQEAAAPPPPTKQEVLLTEIRDLLKQRAASG